MKANEWHQRGEAMQDPIEALSNFWRGFNNLFSAVAQGSERSKIKAYIESELSEDQALEILLSNQAGIRYLLSEPVIDMRGNGRDTSSSMRSFIEDPANLQRLVHLFMVIYQIRCNLEHGQKSPNLERDVRLCQSAAPIVGALIKISTQPPRSSVGLT